VEAKYTADNILTVPHFDLTHHGGMNFACRGSGGDASVPDSQVQQEICGELPTGLINSYPQLAGYYKQEILSLSSAIQQVVSLLLQLLSAAHTINFT